MCHGLQPPEIAASFVQQALAQAWNTAVVPHVWGTGVGLAASLQFIASLPPTPLSLNPEEPMLKYDRSSHPSREDLIGAPSA